MTIYISTHKDKLGDVQGRTFHLNKTDAKSNPVNSSVENISVECVKVAWNKWDIIDFMNDYGGKL